jgi:hypothetical protein
MQRESARRAGWPGGAGEPAGLLMLLLLLHRRMGHTDTRRAERACRAEDSRRLTSLLLSAPALLEQRGGAAERRRWWNTTICANSSFDDHLVSFETKGSFSRTSLLVSEKRPSLRDPRNRELQIRASPRFASRMERKAAKASPSSRLPWAGIGCLMKLIFVLVLAVVEPLSAEAVIPALSGALSRTAALALLVPRLTAGACAAASCRSAAGSRRGSVAARTAADGLLRLRGGREGSREQLERTNSTDAGAGLVSAAAPSLNLTSTQQFRAMTERAVRLGRPSSKLPAPSPTGGSTKQWQGHDEYDSSDYVWSPDDEIERSRLVRAEVCRGCLLAMQSANVICCCEDCPVCCPWLGIRLPTQASVRCLVVVQRKFRVRGADEQREEADDTSCSSDVDGEYSSAQALQQLQDASLHNMAFEAGVAPEASLPHEQEQGRAVGGKGLLEGLDGQRLGRELEGLDSQRLGCELAAFEEREGEGEERTDAGEGEEESGGAGEYVSEDVCEGLRRDAAAARAAASCGAVRASSSATCELGAAALAGASEGASEEGVGVGGWVGGAGGVREEPPSDDYVDFVELPGAIGHGRGRV